MRSAIVKETRQEEQQNQATTTKINNKVKIASHKIETE